MSLENEHNLLLLINDLNQHLQIFYQKHLTPSFKMI